MHELNRQAYLSAFGIENYMPRLRLPIAPEPLACMLPTVAFTSAKLADQGLAGQEFVAPEAGVQAISPVATLGVLADLVEPKNMSSKAPASVNAAAILQQLEAPAKALALAPFTLSVWRPASGFLIVDSRNTRLALPTEILLSNLLRVLLKSPQLKVAEEVLSWPMVENRFVSRTASDARNELQTWLAVEAELRPIKRLWLMGENAARYFCDGLNNPQDSYWQTLKLDTQLEALILPSLNELLQQPLLKAKLWVCAR